MDELELKDMQGLIVSSYKHHPFASYVLLRVSNPAGARRWLGERAEKFTTAAGRIHGPYSNFALTFSGLAALGLGENVLATFSPAFQEGMASARRSRILGDDGENCPVHWVWGSSFTTSVDALLLIYAENQVQLEAEISREKEAFAAENAFEVVRPLTTLEQTADRREHFGFDDGIGQPVMAGTGNKARQLERTNHATELPPGEFMLGHPNVYGVHSASPVLDAANDPQNLLYTLTPDATAVNAKAGMRDFGRNGSYLVFRQFSQDVARFWNFMDNAVKEADGSCPQGASESLAAKLIGRWPNGSPLVLSEARPDPKLSSENNFSYKEDPGGLKCPFGAHIRRANPRDSLGPDPETALNSANRHRILRRGRSYGPRLADRLNDDGVERGLHFICLNGEIERQFEFVQQTWINNPVFAGLYDEVDPLIGNPEKLEPSFTIQAEPLRKRCKNLASFVKVKGGAYFFLPSIRAIRYLAALQAP